MADYKIVNEAGTVIVYVRASYRYALAKLREAKAENPGVPLFLEPENEDDEVEQ